VIPGTATLLWYSSMAGRQALMRSVWYDYYYCSPGTSTELLWRKFASMGTVSRGWSSRSRHSEGGTNNNNRAEEVEDPQGSSSSAPPAVDADAKSYGGLQQHPGKVADRAHEEHVKHGIDQESIRDVGYDMSKVSKPSGDE